MAIACRDQFPHRLPDQIADWDIVEVTLWEALHLLAGDGLVLGPREIVIDDRLPHIGEQLEVHGVTAYTLPCDTVTKFAGGFRCSHHPIIRELG